MESLSQQRLSLLLANRNQTQPSRNNSGKPVVSKRDGRKALFQAAVGKNHSVSGGSVAMRQAKRIPWRAFAIVHCGVKREQTFPSTCTGVADCSGRPDGGQLLVYTIEGLEITCFERKHGLDESQSLTGNEDSFQKMLHPFTERHSIIDSATGNGCLESIRICKCSYGEKRIRDLQAADELNRFHQS